jgi:uncharacterized membrane protein
MIATALLLLADKASKVGSGAVLTLALPLGLTLVALLIWWQLARRAGRAAEPIEVSAQEAEPAAAGPAPE